MYAPLPCSLSCLLSYPCNFSQHVFTVSVHADQTEFSIFLIAQTPLIVATDIRNMTSIMQQALLNAELLAIHRDIRTPPGDILGFAPCDASNPTACQLWGRALFNTSTYAAVLFNAGENTYNVTLDLALIDWADETVAVRDMFNHVDLPGTYEGQYTAELAPHASTFVLLQKTA